MRQVIDPKMKTRTNSVMETPNIVKSSCKKRLLVRHSAYLTEPLIKLTMFLVTVFCSQQAPRASCLSYRLSQQQQFFHPNQLDYQSARLNQMIRNNQQLHQQPLPFRPDADRRASSSENGKVLVCYYTTRGQSAPYWPSDTSGYVIPADQLGENGREHEAAGGQSAPTAELRQESGFAPIVAGYDRSVNGPQKNGFVAQTQRSSGNQHDPQGYSYAKNQQQQLVFKSPLNAQEPISMQTPAANGFLANSLASNNNNNGLLKSAEQHQYQDAGSHLLAGELNQNNMGISGNGNNINILLSQHNQQQQQQQQALIINNGNPKKQAAPSYSLVGNSDLDSTANNGGGLIVSSAPMSSSGYGNDNGNNGDNGGFIISGGGGKENNNGNHQERNSPLVASASVKQQVPAHHHQQLVFPHQQQQQQQQQPAPSLSRAFIVGSTAATPSVHNEVLDTKSQLFISHNNRHLQQQQQQVAAERQKGKSLQLLASGSEQQQLSPILGQQHPQQQLTGFVSSTPPVPSTTTAQATTQHAATFRSNNNNSQQFSFLPSSANTNQPIVGIGQSTALKSPASSKLACQAGDCPAQNGKQSAASSRASPAPATASSAHHLQAAAPGNSLSSALVSSPLSAMFDVFGAASQYLMRFKPSSLISPSSFVFNTIQSDTLHHGLKTGNSTSLLGSAGSLIPLPYVPANMIAPPPPQTKSSSPTSPPVASASETESIGDSSPASWSRFALQNSQQRREDVCGRTIQTPQRRIIGGEGARYGEFPYQVHIKIAKHQCGGALVDKQSIVTAAHCVYHFITRAPVNKLQIVIGAYDIEDEQYQELPPQYFKVNKVKLHPNFRFSASHPDRYDIAILKLDKPVKYTDNVLPVCLPSKDIKYESLVGTVTGFGKTDPSLSNRYGTRLLQKVDVPIIENNECERWHRTRGIDLKIFPEMMCAGYEDGLKDACVGDSGGPLVVKTAAGPNGSFRWTLAGITSAGFGCAQSRQPGIYHRVSHTVDWILENLD